MSTASESPTDGVAAETAYIEAITAYKSALAATAAVTAPIVHGKAIVIADRGWVWVGDVVTDAAWTRIAGAQNVIRWGTDAGIGQLALEGPQKNTRLGPPGDVLVQTRAVIAVLPVEADKWPTA